MFSCLIPLSSLTALRNEWALRSHFYRWELRQELRVPPLVSNHGARTRDHRFSGSMSSALLEARAVRKGPVERGKVKSSFRVELAPGWLSFSCVPQEG